MGNVAILARGVLAGFLGLVLVTAAGCGGGGGGGSGAPVIVSVTDGAGNAVAASGTTGVFPTQFTVTFDQAMDDASVTTAGNISGTCGGHEATFTVTATGTAGEYLVVPDGDAWKVALLECAVTFSANIKSSGGTPMVAATYTFTNACAVNDDFNAQSISDESTSCWQIYPDGISTYPTWASMIGVMSFDTANSTLDGVIPSSSSDRNGAVFYKTVSIEDTVSAEIHIISVSQESDDASVTLALYKSDLSGGIRLGTNVSGSVNYCNFDISFGGAEARYSAPCSLDTEYYIRMSFSGSTLGVPEYRLASDIEYTPMTLVEGTVPAIDFGTEDPMFLLVYSGGLSGVGSASMSVDSVTLDGASVEGQY